MARIVMELVRQLQNMPARIRVRVASMDRRRLAVAAVLAVLALGGVAWLAVGSGTEKWTPVLETSEPGTRAAAAEKLDKLGIAHREDGARLLVRSTEAPSARSAIAASARADEPAADGQDLWQTESQRSRRWQAEKAATLGRIIAGFPGVKNAVVLLEAATSKGLGHAAQSATAAVSISMAQGQELTRELAVKIARLVSGSVASMRCEDVRIIDSGGGSVRVDESGQPFNAAPALQARWAQGEAVQAVQASLRHVGEVRVRVGLAADESPKVTGVWLSVPESCLAGADGAEAAAAGIRRIAARAAGISENDVTLAYHRDATVAPPAAPTPAPAARARATWLWAVPGGTAATVAVLSGVLVWRRIRRRRPAGEPPAPGEAATPSPSRLPQLLQSIPCDELLTAVREECGKSTLRRWPSHYRRWTPPGPRACWLGWTKPPKSPWHGGWRSWNRSIRT
ncbi:MAG: hypothetical protein NT031_19715 [Planctomycetota bacterium]|nr:hypothetical protein [Planctomycetota bacterium]